MASPTAIPNPGASAHHQPSTPPPSSSTNAFSRSPTGTTPNPLVSPIYTSAGRSAFSLPGPNSNSTSPTTTSWYSAGFASNNSQRVRSPTANFASSSTVTPQRDYFMDSNTSPVSAHYRKASFGSASQSSSISSADLEPTTPKATEGGGGGGGGGGGAPLGRVPSIPMGTSFEQLKSHRQSWGGGNAGWNGLNGLRGNGAENGSSAGGGGAVPVSMPNNGGGAMGGIFRKFSFGSASQTPTKSGTQIKAPAGNVNISGGGAAMTAPASAPSQVTSQPMATQPATAGAEPVTRGRQASVSAGGKRRPSPMGERLLMGHFNAH